MGRFGLYERSGRGSQVGTALTFLFIGLGLGALSALLFAPQSGEKTRKMIRRRYERHCLLFVLPELL